MADPFEHSASWWHCIIPCVTLWLGLVNLMFLSNYYVLVLDQELLKRPQLVRIYMKMQLAGASAMLPLWYFLQHLNTRHSIPLWWHGVFPAMASPG
jgi:hypothetical protein